jgi:hypothetical protein
MRRFVPFLALLAGCDAQSSLETTFVFVVLFGTLGRLFLDGDAR